MTNGISLLANYPEADTSLGTEAAIGTTVTHTTGVCCFLDGIFPCARGPHPGSQEKGAVATRGSGGTFAPAGPADSAGLLSYQDEQLRLLQKFLPSPSQILETEALHASPLAHVHLFWCDLWVSKHGEHPAPVVHEEACSPGLVRGHHRDSHPSAAHRRASQPSSPGFALVSQNALQAAVASGLWGTHV